MYKLLAASLVLLATSGCVTFAPPSPMVTLGGPATTAPGVSEVGLAVGGGGVMFASGHDGGLGAFGRYKRGLNERFDLGVDAIVAKYSDSTAISAKLAGRYQLAPHWRLEGGLGGADASEGRSANADLGITWGTRNGDRTWNWYTTLRIGAAKGYGGDDLDDEDAEPGPADTFFTMLSVGTQAALNPGQRFVFEGGVGSVDPHGFDVDPMVYITVGMLFDVGDAR